jgi:hypothetical protein
LGSRPADPDALTANARQVPEGEEVIDWKNLPPGTRRQVWWVAVVLVLLLAVAFLLGFTAGRWFEHGR